MKNARRVRSGVWSLEEVSQLPQTGVRRIPDDHMVEHFHFQELPGPDKVTSHFDVRFTWRRLPARMIVHEHNGARTARDGGSEHLARMDQNGVHRARCNQVMSPDASPGVQVQHNEAFALRLKYWCVVMCARQ